MNRAVLGDADPATVPSPADTLAFHHALPGYEATPLVRMGPTWRTSSGSTTCSWKDKSHQFGLPAFKFLGASWAVAQMLGGLQRHRRAARGGGPPGHRPADDCDRRQPRAGGGADGEAARAGGDHLRAVVHRPGPARCGRQ